MHKKGSREKLSHQRHIRSIKARTTESLMVSTRPELGTSQGHRQTWGKRSGLRINTANMDESHTLIQKKRTRARGQCLEPRADMEEKDQVHKLMFTMRSQGGQGYDLMGQTWTPMDEKNQNQGPSAQRAGPCTKHRQQGSLTALITVFIFP